MDKPRFCILLASIAVVVGTKLKLANAAVTQVVTPPLKNVSEIDGDNLVIGLTLLGGIISLLIRRK